MRVIIIFILAVTLYACDKTENEIRPKSEYTQSDFLGKWFDLDGCESLMQTDSGQVLVEDREIVFTFSADSSYSKQSKNICIDVFYDGSWEFDEQTNILSIQEEFDSPDSIIVIGVIETRHNWEILKLSEDTLQVNHTFLIGDGDDGTSTASLPRKFVKVE